MLVCYFALNALVSTNAFKQLEQQMNGEIFTHYSSSDLTDMLFILCYISVDVKSNFLNIDSHKHMHASWLRFRRKTSGRRLLLWMNWREACVSSTSSLSSATRIK